MPWSRRDRPSAAIGALAAWLSRERPSARVIPRSEFVRVSEALGADLYDALSVSAYSMGELLYLAILYPERMSSVRVAFDAWAAERQEHREAGTAFDDVIAALQAHLERAADAIVAEAPDVLGLTTSFGQLFANITLARAVKARRSSVRVVLGGSTVSSRVGSSILGEYPEVDYVVQGEGERPLLALVDALMGVGPPPSAGVVARGDASPARLWEVDDLDALPLPTFDEYVALAEEANIHWELPIEGSRGCWWDRTRRAGDPTATCYFCNLNVQWGGYREKSVARVIAEADELSSRYTNPRIYFLDNILRARGAIALGEGLRDLGKDLTVFYEMRAHVTSRELLAMWEGGLRSTQLGIEALSTSLLRRMGKGTSTIQNLQAMRGCLELGILNIGNLIVAFPGTTPAEYVECTRVVRDFALSFTPLSLSRFGLGMDSTVDALRERFGVTDVRNSDAYAPGMPAPVRARLTLFDRAFDLATPPPSFADLYEACESWRALHVQPRREPLLHYRDGGTYLAVYDERFGDIRTGVFTDVAREIYLSCMEVRTRGELGRRFAERATDAALDEILAAFEENRILFREGDRLLSLAVAAEPAIAARRIRASEARGG